MVTSLVSALDALLAFADEHAGQPLNPFTFVSSDQMAELAALDTDFFAHCQLNGLSLSVIPDPICDGFSGFGNSRLPYGRYRIHHPIKDEAGNMANEMVACGTMIFPTPEWRYAMMSLRATAILKAKAEQSGKMATTSRPSTASADQGTKLGAASDKDPDQSGAGRKSEKRKRGRPVGGKTQEQDRKLYLDWKEAYRTNRTTKREFLHEKGLPESELDAIERGRKQKGTKTGLENRPGKGCQAP